MRQNERYKLPLPRPKRALAVRDDPKYSCYNIYQIRDYGTYIPDAVN